MASRPTRVKYCMSSNQLSLLKSPRPLFGYRKFWAHRFGPAPFLPMSRAEMDTLGWDSCDIILITGDAYIDHPSFRHGPDRPPARSPGLPRRHHQPAGLEFGQPISASSASPTCSTVLPPATWTR